MTFTATCNFLRERWNLQISDDQYDWLNKDGHDFFSLLEMSSCAEDNYSKFKQTFTPPARRGGRPCCCASASLRNVKSPVCYCRRPRCAAIVRSRNGTLASRIVVGAFRQSRSVSAVNFLWHTDGVEVHHTDSDSAGRVTIYNKKLPKAAGNAAFDNKRPAL